MKKLLTAALAATALLGFSAGAVQRAPDNANKIVKVCTQDKSEVGRAACNGFVSGVIETTRLYVATKSLEPPFCIPSEVALSQTVEVYTTYLEENHVLNRFSATVLAVTAFNQAYPCE